MCSLMVAGVKYPITAPAYLTTLVIAPTLGTLSTARVAPIAPRVVRAVLSAPGDCFIMFQAVLMLQV